MKRRQFLRSMMAVAGANTLLSGNPLSFKVRTAQASAGKTLITLFQRGGCDGLNSIVPYTEERYYQLRPTIAIAPPDANNTESVIDINGTFGFHPSLAPLMPIYQAGNLAILPTVHYPNASRSHFSGQHFIESAQQQDLSDGWLNRHLQTQQFDSAFRAVDFGDELAQSLRGDATAATLNSLDSFNLGVSEDEQSLLLQNMGKVFAQETNTNPTKKLLHRFGVKVTQDLALLQEVRNQVYVPANGAQYPNSIFGRTLMQIAQLTKAGIGLELATASLGGWDHHAGQGGAQLIGHQARAHDNFSKSIAALYTDLGEKMQDVVIMTQTEFGRSAAENGSQGTDHGYASTWYAMGGGIKSGIYGEWPGLAEDRLEQGRFLQKTVDYRDIYGEILRHHLQNNQTGILLPDHDMQNLGIFGV
jgi:uncharacterized protein (DUF1501 family)